MMMRPTTLAILTATASMLALGAAAHAQQVGTASAVNPAATINMRTITIGSSISHMERIRTTESGSVQVLFVDKTSMTVGPNSDLTIDEYVFDPKSGEGKLVASLGKGALRFVGGLISHAGNAEIKTSSATIGIRGGILLANGPNLYVGYGTSTVTSGGATVSLGAGEFTRTGRGQPPLPPGPPPPNFVSSQLQLFQSAGGQSGGVSAGHASPRNVAAAERRATGSNGGVAGQATTPPTPNITRIGDVKSTLDQTIQTSAQSRAVQSSEGGGRPTTVLVGLAGGVVRDQFTSGSNVGQYYNASIIGGVVVALDAIANRIQANFGASYGTGGTDQIVQYGSLDPADPTPSTYTNYSTFSAQLKKDANLTASGVSGEITSLSQASTRQLGASLGQPNLTVCQCEYTRWGFWSVKTPDPNLGIFGTWVAGQPALASDMPTTGTASYVGHVIANVGGNSGDVRQAVGNFSNTVDFGARTGAVAVTGLDNTNYRGNVPLVPGSVAFGGNIAGDVGNRNMTLVGGFTRGATSPVGEMGGTVTITGTNYVGGGSFAAALQR